MGLEFERVTVAIGRPVRESGGFVVGNDGHTTPLLFSPSSMQLLRVSPRWPSPPFHEVSP